VTEFLSTFSAAALAGNFLLVSGLGLGVFPQGARKLSAAGEEALSAILVVTGTAALAILLEFFFFRIWHLEFLRIPVYLLIGFLVSKIVEYYARLPYRDTFLSLALAVCLLAEVGALHFAQVLGLAAGAASGVGLVLVLGAGWVERWDFSPLPKDFRAVCLFFFSLGLLALVFKGFQGLVR